MTAGDREREARETYTTSPELRKQSAERLALRIPAPCVCVDVPLCNQHKIAAKLIAGALATERVVWEAEAAALRARVEARIEVRPYDGADWCIVVNGKVVMVGGDEAMAHRIANDLRGALAPQEREEPR